MKKTMIFLSIFVLAACAKVEKEDLLTAEENSNDPFSSEKQTGDVPTCQGPSPIGASVYSTEWRLDSVVNGDSRKVIMKVEPNGVSIDTTCYYGNAGATVNIRANASVTSEVIHVLSNDSAEMTVKVGDKEKKCSTKIGAGTIYKYSFSGNCLKLTTNGSTTIMIPTQN